MELELANKVFFLREYTDKSDMEKHIKEYIKKLKNDYPMAIVTREFYKENGILIRATKIENKTFEKKKEQEQNELEKEEIKIIERGINGLGENIDRTVRSRESREKEIGGTERER